MYKMHEIRMLESRRTNPRQWKHGCAASFWFAAGRSVIYLRRRFGGERLQASTKAASKLQFCELEAVVWRKWRGSWRGGKAAAHCEA